MRNRNTAALLAFFLGGIGAHRFYLGQMNKGLLYLLFCWTFIPSFIALFDAITFWRMNDNTFNEKYKDAPQISFVSFKSIATGLFAIAMIWYLFGGGIEHQAKENMRHIENEVAQDAIKQYEIAKRNGSAMDAYTQASLVTAAFLQANDENNYKKWKEIQKKEAKAAGLPESFE